jgi:hypothetical protein
MRAIIVLRVVSFIVTLFSSRAERAFGLLEAAPARCLAASYRRPSWGDAILILREELEAASSGVL